MQVAVYPRGSTKMSRVDCPSHSQKMGLTWTEMLDLADAFSAQKPQDCIVVSGGNQIEKLQRRQEEQILKTVKIGLYIHTDEQTGLSI